MSAAHYQSAATDAAHETFVERDTLRLWTASSGRGRPILLANGGPGCCDYLAPVAAMLDDMAQVVRFEASGCGRSASLPAYTLATCLAEVEAIRQQYGFDRWIVAGHSWGADLALIYALTYPERVEAILCIAGGRVHNDREWHRAFKENGARAPEPMPDFAYPWNMDVNEQVGRDWKQYIQRPGLFRELAALSVPALFVYGKQDIRPSWPVEQVAALLPNGQMILVDGAPHCLWLTHADELRAHLRGFVAGLE